MITISERREHESAKSFVLRVLIDNIINLSLIHISEPTRRS